MSIEFKDHSPEVLAELKNAVARACEEIGMYGETYAQDLAPYDTGMLKISVTHQVHNDGSSYNVDIGTNSEYAIYQEFGTGIYSTLGGRQTPWVYEDANGDWHYTHGNRAQPFIKPAVADHTNEYKARLERQLKGG